MGLLKPLIFKKISDIEISLGDIAINVKKFGAKGDGVTDDTSAIQSAIDYAQSFIVRNGISYFGAPRVLFPNGKYRITSNINVKEAIDICGEGFGTNIFLDGTNAGIWYVSVHNNWPLDPTKGDSKSILEGWQVFGGSIQNMRFFSDRTKSIQSAIKIGNYDHIYLNNLWFWGIKGKCIEMQTVREQVINNIWCRYCGDVGIGNIESIQALPTQESTNLGLCNNWNIVDAYGNSIKLVNGQLRLHNFCIHGTHSGSMGSEELFFPSETITIGGALVSLTNSSLQISKGSMVYGRDAEGYFKLDASTLNIVDLNISGFYTTADVNTNFIFDMYNSSNLYVFDMNLTGVSNGNVIRKDGTTHTVNGSFLGRIGNESLGNTVTKKEFITNYEMHGDYQKSIRIKPYIGVNPTVSSEYLLEPNVDTANNSTINANIIWQNSVGNDILRVGYSAIDNSLGIVQLPNDTMLRLGHATDNNSTQLSNCLWVNNGYVKANVGGVVSVLSGKVQSASASATANNGTITTSGVSLARVNPVSAVTGVILQAGTYGGQEVTVINEATSSNSITFAASGSNVSDGVSDVISGGAARKFVWDTGTSLWYRLQ